MSKCKRGTGLTARIPHTFTCSSAAEYSTIGLLLDASVTDEEVNVLKRDSVYRRQYTRLWQKSDVNQYASSSLSDAE